MIHNPTLNPKIVQLCEATAHAECGGRPKFGDPIPGDSLPARSNNPGDLRVKGKQVYYETVEDGWMALYGQWEMMANGESHIYTPQMTFVQIGAKYDGEPEYMEWVDNMCDVLCVESTVTLEEFMSKGAVA